MEKRPENIKTFETSYLKEIRKRCKILVMEVLQKQDISWYIKYNNDIDKIDKELYDRESTLFDKIEFM